MKRRTILNVLFAMSIVAAGVLSVCKAHKNVNYDETNVDTVTAQDYLRKGNIQLDLKNYKEALELFNKSINIDPEVGETFSLRGMTKYHLKDYKGALKDYDEAIKLIPDFGEVYDLRGIVKSELGDKEGACEDWNKSYELGFNAAFKLIEKYCLDDDKK